MREWTSTQRIVWLSIAGWLLFVLLSPWAIYLYVLAQPYAAQMWQHKVEFSFFGYHYVVILLISAPLGLLLASLPQSGQPGFRGRTQLLLGLLMLHVFFPTVYVFFGSQYNLAILLTCLIDNLLLWALTITFWHLVTDRVWAALKTAKDGIKIQQP